MGYKAKAFVVKYPFLVRTPMAPEVTSGPGEVSEQY